MTQEYEKITLEINALLKQKEFDAYTLENLLNKRSETIASIGSLSEKDKAKLLELQKIDKQNALMIESQMQVILNKMKKTENGKKTTVYYQPFYEQDATYFDKMK